MDESMDGLEMIHQRSKVAEQYIYIYVYVYKPPVIITHRILSNLIFSRYFPGQAHLIPLDIRRCGPCFGGLAKPKSQTLCRHPACWWWHLKARNPG